MKKILLLLFIFGWSCANAQNKSDEFRAKAEKLTDDYDEALKYYNLSLAEALKNNDFVRAANVSVDISSLYHSRADYQTALSYCWSGSDFLQKATIKPDTVLFKISSSMGIMYKNINRKDSAYYYFGLADKLLEKNRNITPRIPEYVQSHFNIQGRWLNSMGEFKNGILLIEKALEIAKKYRLIEEENIALTNLSAVYQTLGIYDKALKYRFEALKILTEDNLLKCYNLSGIGWGLRLNKEPQKGLKYLKEGEHIYQNLLRKGKVKKNIDLQTTLLYNTGACLVDMNDYLSEKYFLKIIDEFTKTKQTKALTLSKAWLQLGTLRGEKGDLEQHTKYLQNALIAGHTNFASTNLSENPAVRGAINDKYLVSVLIEKGKNLERLYRGTTKEKYLVDATKTYLRGIEIINELRGSYDNAESKLFLNEQIYSIYDLALKSSFQLFEKTQKLQHKEDILYIIESSKAAILSDVLHESLIKPQTIPYQLLNKESKLKNDILKLKTLNFLDSIQLSKLRDLELKRYNLLREFEQGYPNYYTQKYGRKKYISADIQTQLSANDFFISYYISSSDVYIIGIDKDNFEIIKQPIEAKTFILKLKQFKDLIYQNPGLSVYDGVETSAYLHKTLFLPTQKWINGKTRLIICRDWQFNFLPFEILETGRYINDYLVKKYSFRYVYSVELLLNQPPSNTNNTVLGIAPFTQNNDTRYKHLPDSESQIRKISNNILIDRQATKDAFLKYYQDFGIIYLATHSIVSDINPGESFVAFYPTNDHRLTINEIYDLKLDKTNLVVLSSCDAGNGKTYKSEGTFSLARAFSYAGCKSILTTLWATNDASSAYLTERFHHHLTKGEPKDIALQKARLDFFDSDFGKKYNHPFFWGNFNLIGNADPVFQYFMPKTYYIFGILGLFVVIFLFNYKKTKKEKSGFL